MSVDLNRQRTSDAYHVMKGIADGLLARPGEVRNTEQKEARAWIERAVGVLLMNGPWRFWMWIHAESQPGGKTPLEVATEVVEPADPNQEEPNEKIGATTAARKVYAGLCQWLHGAGSPGWTVGKETWIADLIDSGISDHLFLDANLEAAEYLGALKLWAKALLPKED